MNAYTRPLAIIGADSLLAEAICERALALGWPLEMVRPLGREDQVGEWVEFGDQSLEIGDLDKFDFHECVACIVASRDEAAIAAAQTAGCPVIGENVDGAATAVVTALANLHQTAGIVEIRATLLRASANFGRAGVEELAQQTQALFNQHTIQRYIFPKRLAFNVLPAIRPDTASHFADSIKAGLDSNFLILATEATVPVFYGDLIQLDISLAATVSAEQIQTALQTAATLLTDEQASPMDVAGQDDILVSGLRSPAPGRISLWLAFDGTRQAATAIFAELAHALADA
ncbi:Asd/ArgC dimerization domain-containing protein [Parachitinimonas caeni]|uniref:Asd/ArgC dimerization domain-containing protein n=1 Tax=Parachitinimonas caeni TaxID=3031301 RepID=A0ABT7E333_9NEIS|nr:Asd/ArgC dimerization domain-containing protein [Parachitinimonas caeni]MDK2125723.1 Asd/ArgC dimerization domain-containing protein [Parachitinimonas caeni]